MGQVKNKWVMVSSAGQNWQVKLPIHFLFFILSFVAIALCQINQSQILILRGILAFQSCLKLLSTPTAESLLYKDLTENNPESVLGYCFNSSRIGGLITRGVHI
jgi:hypothetical protein